jgi:hypothetical protein
MRHWWDDDRETLRNKPVPRTLSDTKSDSRYDGRTVSRSVRLGVEVLHDQICCYVSIGTPPLTMYTNIQFIPHREHNFQSTNQSFNAAQRNHHCFMWRITQNTRTHCVGKTWRWTPVICGPEFLTYVEYLECCRASSAFRRGVNEILALLEFYEA